MPPSSFQLFFQIGQSLSNVGRAHIEIVLLQHCAEALGKTTFAYGIDVLQKLFRVQRVWIFGKFIEPLVYLLVCREVFDGLRECLMRAAFEQVEFGSELADDKSRRWSELENLLNLVYVPCFFWY